MHKLSRPVYNITAVEICNGLQNRMSWGCTSAQHMQRNGLHDAVGCPNSEARVWRGLHHNCKRAGTITWMQVPLMTQITGTMTFLCVLQAVLIALLDPSQISLGSAAEAANLVQGIRGFCCCPEQICFPGPPKPLQGTYLKLY